MCIMHEVPFNSSMHEAMQRFLAQLCIVYSAPLHHSSRGSEFRRKHVGSGILRKVCCNTDTDARILVLYFPCMNLRSAHQMLAEDCVATSLGVTAFLQATASDPQRQIAQGAPFSSHRDGKTTISASGVRSTSRIHVT